MSARDIIKFLPLDENLKIRILSNYDDLTPTQKYSIDSLAWKTYDLLFKMKLEENLNLESEKVKNGTMKLGEDFYEKALIKTEKEMKQETQSTINNVNLTLARKSLEKIMDEIKASKKAHKKIN